MACCAIFVSVPPDFSVSAMRLIGLATCGLSVRFGSYAAMRIVAGRRYADSDLTQYRSAIGIRPTT